MAKTPPPPEPEVEVKATPDRASELFSELATVDRKIREAMRRSLRAKVELTRLERRRVEIAESYQQELAAAAEDALPGEEEEPDDEDLPDFESKPEPTDN